MRICWSLFGVMFSIICLDEKLCQKILKSINNIEFATMAYQHKDVCLCLLLFVFSAVLCRGKYLRTEWRNNSYWNR